MKVYFDTGIFIDYISLRNSVVSQNLRVSGRNQRTSSDLALDAERCFERVRKKYSGITSSMTFYEVEEALYKGISNAVTGVSMGKKFLIPTVRSVVPQVIMTTDMYDIEVLALTQSTIFHQLANVHLQTFAIRSADALHISLAIEHDAEIFISGDRGILALDNQLVNSSGKSIRFVDTDIAKQLL
ncbi:Uncharacterised protein [Vibrio owensii]|uniref:hypothetical protein n=1 Tax=Vibrio owensii TaxID=696485 RepID=UPI0005774B87|nr:hypothetical protein [Vibrio owensii]SUQ02009.1 Uncharacterised protein [Vibrio owensii]